MSVKTIKKNRGFALLFSVLISSLLLTIGLSIFSIALKELSISTAARQSVHAFFAADSGREYVLYQDVKKGSFVVIADTSTSNEINITSATSSAYVLGSSGPRYDVILSKYREAASSTGKIKTTIISRGYDSDGDDRVERAIEQTY